MKTLLAILFCALLIAGAGAFGRFLAHWQTNGPINDSTKTQDEDDDS